MDPNPRFLADRFIPYAPSSSYPYLLNMYVRCSWCPCGKVQISGQCCVHCQLRVTSGMYYSHFRNSCIRQSSLMVVSLSFSSTLEPILQHMQVSPSYI